MLIRAVRSQPWAVAFALALIAVGCEVSETIAPEGSSIILTASPAQIVLAGGIQKDPVTILATVTNSLGVPIPGQSVRFTTSSGDLMPPQGTPIETDANGNATCILDKATAGPQITARSGKVSAMMTLQAATGILNSITLTPGPLSLNSCSDKFNLTATASDPSGNPVKGVTIILEFTQTGATFITGQFNPNQGVSDVNGKLPSELDIDDIDCGKKCPGMSCSGEIRARNQAGTVLSSVVTINDNVN